jgi:hypothetical protein
MSTSPLRTWLPVILIGLSTTIGLFAALLGDGAWDWLSAATLGMPVIVAIKFGLSRSSHRSGERAEIR